MKKKIIVVSNPGELQDFVIANGIGFAVKPNNGFKDFETALTQYNPAFDFDVAPYSIHAGVQQLIQVLQ